MAVTVADDAVVRWLGGLHAPGLVVLWRGLAHGGSWWALTALVSGLLLALLVLRRLRHLIVWLVAWPLVMPWRTSWSARPPGGHGRSG